jgi:four helix bundle protein
VESDSSLEKNSGRKIVSFRDLDAWQRCFDVKMFFFEISRKLPKDEKFILTEDIRRASISITANIAEGYGRFHFQENIQYCRQSRGSLYELWDHLISCRHFKYIAEEEYNRGAELIESAVKVVNGYINFLNKQKAKIIND